MRKFFAVVLNSGLKYRLSPLFAGKAEIRDKRVWIKLHLMCGVKTNIVTAVEVSDAIHRSLRLVEKPVESIANTPSISRKGKLFSMTSWRRNGVTSLLSK